MYEKQLSLLSGINALNCIVKKGKPISQIFQVDLVFMFVMKKHKNWQRYSFRDDRFGVDTTRVSATITIKQKTNYITSPE